MATSILEFLITAKDEASEVFEKVGKAAEKQEGGFDKIKAGAVVGLGAAGLAAVKFGKDSVEAYADAQKSQAALEDAFTKFPKLADTNASSMEDLDEAIQNKTGADHNQIESGQAVLAQFNLTGKQVEQITPLLVDYAEKTGKTIPSAAKILGLALDGNTRGLKAIGITAPSAQQATGKLASAQSDAASKGSNFTTVMDGLNQKVGGFADTQGKTAAGQADILKGKFDDLEESVGSALMPALSNLASVLITVFTWINNNQTAAAAIAITLGVLGTAMAVAASWTGIQTAAENLATAATWLWDAAMDDNPIGIVIIAIAALVAGIVELIKHWGSVEAAGVAAWNWIKGAWSDAGAWFAGIGSDIAGAFSSAWSAVTRIWGKVTSWFSSIVSAIGRTFSGIGRTISGFFSSALGDVKHIWSGITGWFSNLVSDIGRIFSRIISVITTPFRKAVSEFESIWNSSVGGKGFSVPGWIPGIGGKSFRIPKLATGGTIAQGGWAVVGERGPEVAWLPGGSHVYPHGTGPDTGGGISRDDLAWLAAQIARIVTATTDARTSVAFERLLEG